MNPRLIPGTIILCVTAIPLGILGIGAVSCFVDAVKKEREKEKLDAKNWQIGRE